MAPRSSDDERGSPQSPCREIAGKAPPPKEGSTGLQLHLHHMPLGGVGEAQMKEMKRRLPCPIALRQRLTVHDYLLGAVRESHTNDRSGALRPFRIKVKPPLRLTGTQYFAGH